MQLLSLLSEEPVLVTVLLSGFMTTLDEHLPGNYGFLDMVEALKWINENIRFFGGDPDKVTVGGYNTGGASAMLLAMSPLAEGICKSFVLH